MARSPHFYSVGTMLPNNYTCRIANAFSSAFSPNQSFDHHYVRSYIIYHSITECDLYVNKQRFNMTYFIITPQGGSGI